MSKSLEALAKRAEGDPFFLASVLAAYVRGEDLDDAGLAAALNCPVERLTELRLCRAPRADPAGFRQDIDRIAEVFGVDADRLAEVVRYGQVLPHMQGGPPSRGFLLAARDGEAEDIPEEEEP